MPEHHYQISITIREGGEGWTSIKVTLRPRNDDYNTIVTIEDGLHPTEAAELLLMAAVQRAQVYAMQLHIDLERTESVEEVEVLR